jgi:hypothetical protein
MPMARGVKLQQWVVELSSLFLLGLGGVTLWHGFSSTVMIPAFLAVLVVYGANLIGARRVASQPVQPWRSWIRTPLGKLQLACLVGAILSLAMGWPSLSAGRLTHWGWTWIAHGLIGLSLLLAQVRYQAKQG